MRPNPARLVWWAILLTIGVAGPLRAQGPSEKAGLTKSTYLSTRAQIGRIPSLEKTIAVDLDGTSLEQALSQIAARVGLRLTYSTDLLPETSKISLHAPEIKAADAIRRVLRGTSLDLLVAPSGHAVLVPCSVSTCRTRRQGPEARAGSNGETSYARGRVGAFETLRLTRDPLTPAQSSDRLRRMPAGGATTAA